MKQSTMILILLAMVTSVPFFASAQTLETSISTVGCYQNTNILHSGIGVLTKTCYGNLADQKIIYFVRQDGNFEVFQQMGNVKVDSDLNFFNRHVTAYYKYLGTLGQGQWVYVQQEPLTY
ncbi:MAG TPA: hypothetical protein VN132_04040, partial [Bdellovibrio sp.]|nr:hypothetical protein [Bdellovibrio sp.]